eukprot:TRINITY_DN30063_c0_g1_i1.p1 TRINITY_DN30063_c0_g1~~TRINITY_DN30063_c0_g1_i1.p1  ORF type:complete len:242 (+),score=71.94 TRINITY_DN30063_c0_g1_i1:75-800(+)
MPLPDGPAPEPKARGSSDRGPDTDPAACCARQLADALLRTEAAAAAAGGRSAGPRQLLLRVAAQRDACRAFCGGRAPAEEARELLRRRGELRTAEAEARCRALAARGELNRALRDTVGAMQATTLDSRVPAEALDPPRLRYVAALTEALEAKARLLVATVRERGLPAGLVSELAELRVRLEDGIRRAEAEEAELNAELQLYADMQGAHRAEHAALERQYSQLGDELAAAEAMLRAQRRLAQ